MDTRVSALVLGVYVAGVVVIATVAWTYYSRGRMAPESGAVLTVSPPRVAARSVNSFAAAPYHQAAREKANQSLNQLRSSLANTQALLEQRNHALSEKNAECRALQAELDQSFMLILSLLAEESKTTSELEDSAASAKSKLETELSRLIQALGQAETLGAGQGRQLASLQTDLLQADMEFTILREQSELEVAALLAERSALESVVDSVLARCGAAAVPVVAQHLDDERIHIRRWAAKAIAGLGPEAQTAIPTLRRLLADRDAGVRDEASRSLTILESELTRASVSP